jgi:hypothetical protein
MYKIDFFPGSHGHFLELVINTFVAQRAFDFNRPLFDENGACHLHLSYGDPRYRPVVFCKHYSFWNVDFNINDLVIEIHVSPEYLLAALTNNLLRVGNQPVDLYNLHVDTFEKLTQFPKGDYILYYLKQHYGILDHYPRSALRNYFYLSFSSPTYLDETFNKFNHCGKKHTFPFESMFSIDEFYKSLSQSADFLGFKFTPDDRLIKLWEDFLSCNQGYHSHIKCNQIMQALSDNVCQDLTNLSVIEEAWLAHCISQQFNQYTSMELLENFPSSTEEILEKINPVVSRVS